jgi:hypothetical protein
MVSKKILSPLSSGVKKSFDSLNLTLRHHLMAEDKYFNVPEDMGCSPQRNTGAIDAFGADCFFRHSVNCHLNSPSHL